jgi:hypothetical protein
MKIETFEQMKIEIEDLGGTVKIFSESGKLWLSGNWKLEDVGEIQELTDSLDCFEASGHFYVDVVTLKDNGFFENADIRVSWFPDPDLEWHGKISE